MTEEEQYTAEIDPSDMVEDSEQFADIDDHNIMEGIDSETYTILHSEVMPADDPATERKLQQVPANRSDSTRLTRLPIARIKNIMKMDPDVNVLSGEAVFLVTKATELFLETLAKETYTCIASTKRKTIAKKDLDRIINEVDCLCFLEGAMDF